MFIFFILDANTETGMTCDNILFDLFEEVTEKDLVKFLTDLKSKEVCGQNCDSFPTSKSYIYNSNTKECKCLLRSFLENKEHIGILGAPKNCNAALDKCVRKKY